MKVWYQLRKASTAWPFVHLLSFWLSAGSRTLSSCLSVLGQVSAAAQSPSLGPGHALGLLGEEAELGQRHLLPQPCDLPKHRLRCRRKEGGPLRDGPLRQMTWPLSPGFGQGSWQAPRAP